MDWKITLYMDDDTTEVMYCTSRDEARARAHNFYSSMIDVARVTITGPDGQRG